ncbi:nuclear pore complex protein Nup160 [Pocillopora verrucosa]|uniref:nuclear pore complex protein Nup160 n=1 Tax=Pocillopora verrucosa TaxID=203993 RepID=UPI0033420D2F
MASGGNFREVLHHSGKPQGNVINFTIGSATTVRDEENAQPHTGGGFAYRECGTVDSVTRNRYIFWRVTDNVLELFEESLDNNLSGNHLELQFTDGVLLPVVYIFETPAHVSLLIATTNSVHRIAFPHPDRLRRHGFGLSYSSEGSQQSIFNDFSSHQLRSPSNFGTFSQSCVTFASWLCQDGHCLFALATTSGIILLIKLPPPGSGGQVEQYELKEAGVMQRLWSGLVPSSLRRETMASDATLSVGIHPFGNHMCVFALCRDFKLRIWSCQTLTCIYVKDLLEDIRDDMDAQNFPAVGHILRKVVDPSSGKLYLGLFLNLMYNTQFCVYEVVPSSDDDPSLSALSFSHFPKENLVDFAVTTSNIWTLWTDKNGETMSYFTPIENIDAQECGWKRIFLKPTENSDVMVPPYKEPREVFLDQLFYPGRFSNHSILKAMQIYHHLPVSNFVSDFDETVSRSDLKLAVINLIDSEIQMSAPDYEMLHHEYNDLQLQCWTKFYSCVVQYHQVGGKALGIFMDTKTGLVCVVRKEMLSFLRPCDLFEQLHLSEEPLEVSIVATEPHLDKTMKESFIDLCNIIRMVSDQLSPEHLSALENDVMYQLNPALTAEQIAVYLLTNVSDEDQGEADTNALFQFQQELETSLHKIPNIFHSLEFLLLMLESDLIQDVPYEQQTGWSDFSHIMTGHHLFSAPLTCSLLSKAAHQIASSRMSVCKQLLVLLSLMTRLGVNKIGLDARKAEDVSSVFIPRTVEFLRLYVALHWILEQAVTPTPSSSVESNLKQLATLEISDGMESKAVPDDPSLTLGELFLCGVGGTQLRRHLVHKIRASLEMSDQEPPLLWVGFFNRAVYILMDLIWPLRESVIFPEFLLSRCQYLRIQDYAHLICYWCDTCQSSWHFLLGQSYLALGENHKALSCFLKAAKGIGSMDAFVMKVLQSDSTDISTLLVLFYVKVLKLFEQFDAPDYVIHVAHLALDFASPDDPNIPDLWSKIFKHHLELGHNDLAYEALTANPDPVRRRVCLHKLMVTLYEGGQTQELVEYPFVNLQNEFIDIIESHARTVDITTHSFYDLLYAFHVFRGNYRKAGAAMYEHALRLGQEVSGLDSLQKQAKCYLAAMNSLRLVEPKNAWIVKPLDRIGTDKPAEPPNMSPKRKQGEEGEVLYPSHLARPRRKVTVLDIRDLEGEYLLVLARLQLIKMDADPTRAIGPQLSPQESVALLTQAGLFDNAFTVAFHFNLPKETIFEGLASRCVKLSTHGSGLTRKTEEDAWDWLLSNDLGEAQVSGYKSVVDQAWQLLKLYLDKLGPRDGHVYYRCVTSKLLSAGATLPTWLVNDYKRFNATELLRLYINYDLLLEAVMLAVEYIEAVLGKGKEYFGLTDALHGTSPSVWVPYASLDQLLVLLKDVQPDSELAQARDELRELLDVFHEQVTSVSRHMVRMQLKRAQRMHAAESIPMQ